VHGRDRRRLIELQPTVASADPSQVDPRSPRRTAALLAVLTLAYAGCADADAGDRRAHPTRMPLLAPPACG
jgi:hypothetical protein